MEKPESKEVLTVSLTRSEKTQLANLAYNYGATMSGIVRRLIREAASGAARQPPELSESIRNDSTSGLCVESRREP